MIIIEASSDKTSNFDLIFNIKIIKNYVEVDVYKNGKLVLTFHDFSLIFMDITNKYEIDNSYKNITNLLTFAYGNNENDKMFLRVVNNVEYYIDSKTFINKSNKLEYNNKIILKTLNIKTDYLKTIKKERKISNKIITFDIETRVEKNVHIPYCICYFDGKKSYSFYATDFIDHNDMMKHAIKSLLKAKYSNYKVYIHNSSYFDAIFMFNTFADIINDNIKINPIIKDGKMICIDIKYDKYNISFRDSYLILPLSLDKLSKTFAKNYKKYYFPHNFLNDKYNKNINLDYEGNSPDKEYFPNIESYNKFKNMYSDTFINKSPNEFKP
jgi:hypothetical protein